MKMTAMLLAFKDGTFSEEHEWRLVGQVTYTLKPRPGRFGLVPYIGVPLCAEDEQPRVAQITIGPNQEPELAKRGVSVLCWQINQNPNFSADTQVVASKIPYRY